MKLVDLMRPTTPSLPGGFLAQHALSFLSKGGMVACTDVDLLDNAAAQGFDMKQQHFSSNRWGEAS